MLKTLLRRAIPLRRRHQLRLLFGGYPQSLRAHYPDLALLRLRPGAVIFDVGANAGQFAQSALAFQPLAELHVFEPIPEAFARLQAHLAGFDGIHFNNVALGSAAGSRNLVVRRFDQCSSFLELGETLRKEAYASELAAERTLVAQIRRLDDYAREKRVPAIDLLKLDVQGFELEVLRGADAVLDRVRWVYTEAQFQEHYAGGPMFTDTARFLHRRGFDLVRMTSFRFDPDDTLLECDMIFRRRGQDRLESRH